MISTLVFIATCGLFTSGLVLGSGVGGVIGSVIGYTLASVSAGILGYYVANLEERNAD